MKKLVSLLTVFVFTIPCMSYAETVTTSSPLPQNYTNGTTQGYDASRLSNIEMSVFGRNYNGQDINSRLNRLEKSVFNRTYPNSTFQQRIDNLVVNYKNGSRLSPVNSSGKVKSIVNSLNSSLFGTPTGFTPPINPYYSYGDNSYGSNYGDYRDYYSNHGWYRRGNSVGTGTGIHIID